MIRAEIVRSPRGWTRNATKPTFRAVMVSALREELPGAAADARRRVPVSSYAKQHLRDTIGWGIDRAKGQGYLKAGGTRVVWYAHLVELGFHGYTGSRMRGGRRIRGNHRTHMARGGFHPGVRFMGKAIQGRSDDILRSYRKHLDRRLRSG